MCNIIYYILCVCQFTSWIQPSKEKPNNNLVVSQEVHSDTVIINGYAYFFKNSNYEEAGLIIISKNDTDKIESPTALIQEGGLIYVDPWEYSMLTTDNRFVNLVSSDSNYWDNELYQMSIKMTSLTSKEFINFTFLVSPVKTSDFYNWRDTKCNIKFQPAQTELAICTLFKSQP